MADTSDFVPVIVSDGKGNWDQQNPNTGSPPITQSAGARAGEGFEATAERQVERSAESAYSDTFGASLWRSYLAGLANSYGAGVINDPDQLYEPSPKITLGDAKQKYVPADVRSTLPVFEGKDSDLIPDKLAQQIATYKLDQFKNAQDAERFSQGRAWPVRLATDFVAGLGNPYNDAIMASTAMTGGVGSQLFRFLGESALGKIAAGTAAGALTGAAQGTALEGLNAISETDWNIRDAMSDIGTSALFGAAGSFLHEGIGATFKYLRGEPVADPAAAAKLAPVVTADAQTRNAAATAAANQLAGGKPVDVEGFFPDAPKPMDSAGLSGLLADHPFMPREVPGLAADQLDRDTVARQLEPKLFRDYDEQAEARTRAQQQWQDIRDQRSGGAAESADERAAQAEVLQNQLAGKLSKTRRAALTAQLQGLQQTAPIPSAADMAYAQSQMLKADYAMRNMSPAVGKVYDRADEMIARAQTAETGGYAAQVQQRQAQFARPQINWNGLQDIIERDRLWRSVGALPGMTFDEAMAAAREVDDAAAAAPKPEATEKPPAPIEAPAKTSAMAEAEGGTAPAAEPAKPAAPATPKVDTTGMLPQEKALIDGAQQGVQKAAAYRAAYQEAAQCLAEAGLGG